MTRVLLRLMLFVFASMAWAAAMAAYPDRPVRIIVPFPPGGPTDVQARILAQRLGDRLGQPFVVENRSGAGGNIGTRAAAQAAPDGYTLLLMTPAQVINMRFYANPGYDLKKEFTPIGLISTAPALLLANPKLGATNMADVIRIAKAKPGSVAYASAGAGLSTHLMMESIKKTAGIEMIHVPYRGSALALNALIAGEASLLMDSIVSGMPHVRSGSLRAIAVSSAKRTPVAPEIPTISESGLPGFDAITWYGIMAPARTPPEVVRRVAAELNQILKSPDVAKRFNDMGSEPAEVNPESFGKFLEEEAVRWLEVVRQSGARIEE